MVWFAVDFSSLQIPGHAERMFSFQGEFWCYFSQVGQNLYDLTLDIYDSSHPMVDAQAGQMIHIPKVIIPLH